jgi:hypothetical protein
MKRFRKWLKILVFFITIPLLAIGVINYYMDPLWCFSHSHRWNNAQLDLNDRQQKTNALVFQKPDFDSVLLGSSISTYINHNDFRGMKVYNYASPLMRPWEYGGYVANAIKAGGRAPKNIILGLDFFGSNKIMRERFDEPIKYYETANSFLYRYKVLFNIKTFDFSKRNYKQSRKVTRAVYTREYIRSFPDLGRHKIKLTDTDKKTEKYEYNNELKGILGNLKETNSASHFIVFLTPASRHYYCYYVKQGRLPDYKRWVRDVVDVFGGVYNFMYLNPVTENDNNFFDAGHFYPKVGTLIARKISGDYDGNPDFGILVTPENLENHLRFLEENSKGCGK